LHSSSDVRSRVGNKHRNARNEDGERYIEDGGKQRTKKGMKRTEAADLGVGRRTNSG
jgi:hypothetical protein